jgi:hypothetical protein
MPFGRTSQSVYSKQTVNKPAVYKPTLIDLEAEMLTGRKPKGTVND